MFDGAREIFFTILVQGKKFKLRKSYAVPRDATFPTFSGSSYLIVINSNSNVNLNDSCVTLMSIFQHSCHFKQFKWEIEKENYL